MDQKSPERLKEVRVHRRLLAVASAVYLVWWVAVELILPHAFNPLGSRLTVVAIVSVFLLLSFLVPWARRHIRFLTQVGCWLITLHYFYLFHNNSGDINWIVGSFITVTAISLAFFSNAAMLAYSIYVLVLAGLLFASTPSILNSVFLPGLITILIQANIGLRSRLGLMRTLAENTARFQLLFNSTFEGILVHQNNRITHINDALTRMTGFTREELIGGSTTDIVHPEDRAKVLERMTLPDVGPYEVRGLRKDGVSIDLEVRAKNFSFEGNICRLVTVQDVTDRKRAERERIASLSLAESVRIRDEFISIASHELKTPLSSLKLQTHLIERDLRKNPDVPYAPAKIREFTEVYVKQIDRLTELVDTMLDVSRISSGRLILDWQEVDLAAVVRELAAHPRGTNTKIEIEADEKVMISGDLVRIKQVVENLLSNAFKYGEGKPVRVRVFAEGVHALLVVEDSGLGISPEFTERIFDRFERAISPRKISGLGLGLYITRQIVEAHGGRISVQSELGAGSSFVVSFRLSSAHASCEADHLHH